MNKRINIVLPDTTVNVLDRVTTKGTRSRFIDRAVLHYVETQGKQSLREQLAAGYRANAARDLAIAAEWFPLEEQAWETSETSRKPKKKKPTKTKKT
jgi:CopG family transcriptional regulator/antitoxin EndoAI